MAEAQVSQGPCVWSSAWQLAGPFSAADEYVNHPVSTSPAATRAAMQIGPLPSDESMVPSEQRLGVTPSGPVERPFARGAPSRGSRGKGADAPSAGTA